MAKTKIRKKKKSIEKIEENPATPSGLTATPAPVAESIAGDFKLEQNAKTLSGVDLKPFYGPEDVMALNYAQDLGHPGEYPYTRGVSKHETSSCPWVMQRFSSFGTAQETNSVFKSLFAQGETQLLCHFDQPTLAGYDSDHPRSFGYVGRNGVAVDTLADMEEIFRDIPVGRIAPFLASNATAAILYCMYLGAAEKQGVNFKEVSGTVQNDILREFMTQNFCIFPLDPSFRLFSDLLKFSMTKTPHFNVVSVEGAALREAGANAIQELAFSLANAFAYAGEATKAGIEADAFLQRLWFTFGVHMDFFEEIAKFRSVRKIWARWLREKYKISNPHACELRFRAKTANISFSRQQPENNISRATVEALAAVLGGAEGLYVNSMDEHQGIPGAAASRLAMRIQQIIAFESRATQATDPLGGAYFVEALTRRMEEEVENYFRKIDEVGGVTQGILSGYFQKEIALNATGMQRDLDQGRRIVVGSTRFRDGGEIFPVPPPKLESNPEKDQLERLKAVKKSRSRTGVQAALKDLRKTAMGKNGLIPRILDCVREYATVGEMISALKEGLGEYEPPSVF
ncbi:MAG TPA: methylmalonyl-CoA mutase family protein [Candidatus Omnitrophota bacterium]|nr:methylmalonyl-CoA mutase family protein [Candidatus Omnitrophota bacterium]